MGNLCNTYRINDENLRLRRQFIGLTKRDVEVLASLEPWAQKAAAPIAKAFYDFQFEFGPTRDFFTARAAKKGTDLGKMRGHLEALQSRFLLDLFTEAKQGGEFGTSYFERRLQIGKVHNDVDLPPKWYLGSYSLLGDLLRQRLQADFKRDPVLRAEAERAIHTAMNYDQQAVVDAFMYDYFDSVGFELSSVTVARPGLDLSDYLGEIKGTLRGALTETVRAGQTVSESSRDLRAAADELARSSSQQAATLQETTQTLAQLSQTITATFTRVQQASDLTVGGAGEKRAGQGGHTVVSEMALVREGTHRVGTAIAVIGKLASQTNLLALNATLEAARAGDHGAGFKVVAGEVKALARSSGESAQEILESVDAIKGHVQQGSDRVQEVAELLSRIAANSSEQGLALEQLSLAMREMGAATHGTASQNEELAATSRTLETQAERLKEALSRFKL